jgi:hypothetical protein
MGAQREHEGSLPATLSVALGQPARCRDEPVAGGIQQVGGTPPFGKVVLYYSTHLASGALGMRRAIRYGVLTCSRNSFNSAISLSNRSTIGSMGWVDLPKGSRSIVVLSETVFP